ncbi:uncharacterized protein LOC129238234 [Anastrepha obliqua]|uniref:uncharacterized protein LOC129238234 n=1 Tax=Anastrepha obliqua TaxID=95512 RepID=UPI00240A46CD|nr:uncharacterized protein LOC129238234 [Anastrepha obliqua]
METCYLNCALPSTSTTTTSPITSPAIERHQLQQQQQSQQSPKINKSIQETWSLRTVSMLQQDSLVLVDIAWEALNTPNQCLISWEVSGGGLMGNLLTESSNVQLSLWPDTKYRVKVTCKNKLTGFMSRSLPLSIDTSEAVNAHEHTAQHRTQSPDADAMATSTTTVINKIYKSFKNEQQLPQQIANNALEHVQNSNNDDNSALSAHQRGYVAEVENAAVLPYDEHDDDQDQSAETLNQHTNFIFNWHAKNSDISAIEPLQKPNLDVFTIAAFSDFEKPLLFGLIAATFMITMMLLAYRCSVQRHRLAEKDMLIIDDGVHAVVVSMPPAMLAARANNKAAARKAMESGRSDCGGSAQGATSLAYQRGSDEEEEECERGVEEVCSNPAICSRNALKV